jgi:hypothetical protein
MYTVWAGSHVPSLFWLGYVWLDACSTSLCWRFPPCKNTLEEQAYILFRPLTLICSSF